MKKEGKSWRMTEEQFNQKEIDVITKDIDEMRENLESIYKDIDIRKRIKKQIDMFDSYKILHNNIDVVLGRSIISSNMKKWGAGSITLSDPEEITTRALMTNIRGCNCICFAFLSNNPNMTKDLAKDLEYINSGMFKFEDWDDVHVNAVMDALENIYEESPKKNKKMLKLYDEDDIIAGLRYKLNWDDLNRNGILDSKFAKKYKSLISHSSGYYKRKDNEDEEMEEEL